jgi:hypothetical protein
MEDGEAELYLQAKREQRKKGGCMDSLRIKYRKPGIDSKYFALYSYTRLVTST